MQRLRDGVRRLADGRLAPASSAVLRTIAEAGWLTVFYAMASVLADKRPPVVGPIEMALFVVVGALIGVLGRSRPAFGAPLLIGAVVIGGALGVLAGRDLFGLRADDWRQLLGVGIAGWICGIAVLRGAIISLGEKSADQLEQLLRFMPAVLCLVWAYTTYAARQDLWLSFAIAAMWGTAMYLSGSLVAIGMARLNYLHAEVSDERQKRAWRLLVLGVGFGIVPLTIPIAVLAGIPLAGMLAPVIGPIQWLLSLVAYPLAGIIWLLSIVLQPVAGPLAEFFENLETRAVEMPDMVGRTPEVATAIAALITLATIVVVILALLLGARWILVRRQVEEAEPEAGFSDVERSIVVPEVAPPAARQRTRRLGAPRDAVTAYLATIRAMEAHPELARLPAETPAAHAARIRAQPSVRGTDMSRLAATYQLARYGDRAITSFEDSRAVDRFRRIRRAIRGR